MNTAGSYVSLSLWELVSINPVTCSSRWLAFMSYLGIYIILQRIEEKKKKANTSQPSQPQGNSY